MEPFDRQLQDLAARYGLRDIYFFGSRAQEIAARVAGEPPSASVAASDVAVQPLPGHQLDVHERVRLTI